MKIMNRKENKKIAVMAAVIMGFMVIAFMPAASATVTDFTVTPNTGIAGAVQSYSAYVITDGVTSIDITIPAGFIAVAPTTDGEEIARVEFYNSSTKAYYGFATITAGENPTTQVDIDCEYGGETATHTGIGVDYTAGATNTFVSCFGDGSSAIIKLPTEKKGGSIKITITCEDFQLEAVTISIGEFVQNPTTAGDYVFSADGVDETVTITAAGAGGCGAVFRVGQWYLDTDGDHMTDISFLYGTDGDIPVVGDVNRDGRDDDAVYRDGTWYVDTDGDHMTDMSFVYGADGDRPVVGDFNQDRRDDTAVYRAGTWYVDTDGDHMTDMSFVYGAADDRPVVGDFNKDRRDDTAVYRDGTWYVDTTGNHYTDMCFVYGGESGDQPIVGDINQDGRVDTAILRDGGTWYVDTTGNHYTDMCYIYGTVEDLKIGGYFK